MTIFVDYRDKQDKAGPIIPILQQYIVPQSLVQETDLNGGDIAFVGEGPNNSIIRFGIEIKHAGDVLQCIEDNRFSDEQLPKLHQDYDHYWLLIEDDLKPQPGTGVLMVKIPNTRSRVRARIRVGKQMTPAQSAEKNGRWVPALFGAKRTMLYSTMMKWLIEMQYMAGVSLWRTKSRDETAQWIIANYLLWQKPWDKHKALRGFHNRHQGKMMYMNPEMKKLAKFICGFDGIAFERAVVLARKFKSIEDFCLADEKDYIIRDTFIESGAEKTVSIGPKIAASIKEQYKRRRRS
jgi:ERCC4-type nuclease